jgi:hypothetical protein
VAPHNRVALGEQATKCLGDFGGCIPPYVPVRTHRQSGSSDVVCTLQPGRRRCQREQRPYCLSGCELIACLVVPANKITFFPPKLESTHRFESFGRVVRALSCAVVRAGSSQRQTNAFPLLLPAGRSLFFWHVICNHRYTIISNVTRYALRNVTRYA